MCFKSPRGTRPGGDEDRGGMTKIASYRLQRPIDWLHDGVRSVSIGDEEPRPSSAPKTVAVEGFNVAEDLRALPLTARGLSSAPATKRLGRRLRRHG